MILKIVVGEFIPENCYIYHSSEIYSDGFYHGIVVDPGGNPDEILKLIDEKKILIEKIFITHGHYDHVGGLREVQNHFNCPVIMSKNGGKYSSNARWNLSKFFIGKLTFDDLPVEYLENHSKIFLGNACFELIETPGHTSDSAIFYNAEEKFAFVGDTIFQGSHGRFDLPGGSYEQLMNSIRNVILQLPDDTILLPGHNESTTVEFEKTFY